METPRALWRAFLPPVLYWWPFYVTPTFLGLTKSSTVAPHWCFPSHVMPRRLLIRGAQPLIPCTPLSRSRRYKSPCRAIFCLLNSCSEMTSSSLLSCEHPCWDHHPLIATSPLRRPALVLWYYNSSRDSTTSLLSASYCRDKPREPTCYYRFLRRFDTSQHLSDWP